MSRDSEIKQVQQAQAKFGKQVGFYPPPAPSSGVCPHCMSDMYSNEELRKRALESLITSCYFCGHSFVE